MRAVRHYTASAGTRQCLIASCNYCIHSGLRCINPLQSPPMGAFHEQESNVPLVPMDTFPHSTTQHNDPPPYAYMPLSPVTSETSSPIPRKSLLSPPPPEFPFDDSVAVSPSVIPTSSLATTLQDPLLQCDVKFSRLIIQKIILPRLRVGVLKWKDRETLEFYPQNKDDVDTLPSSFLVIFHSRTHRLMVEESTDSEDKSR